MKALLAVAALAALAAPARADGHIPSLWISTDLGVAMTADDEGLPSMGFAFGVEAKVHHTGKNHILYGEGRALFASGVYGARAGVVLGKSLAANYGEIMSVTSTRDYNTNTITTTVTGRSFPQQIHNVLGLDLSASAVSYDGTPGTVLGAGFGWMGQNVFEMQGLYDVANDAAGMRFNFVYALGEKSFSLPISMSVEMFFDFKGHPVPGLILFGLGGGSGFRW